MAIIRRLKEVKNSKLHDAILLTDSIMFKHDCDEVIINKVI